MTDDARHMRVAVRDDGKTVFQPPSGHFAAAIRRSVPYQPAAGLMSRLLPVRVGRRVARALGGGLGGGRTAPVTDSVQASGSVAPEERRPAPQDACRFGSSVGTICAPLDSGAC